MTADFAEGVRCPAISLPYQICGAPADGRTPLVGTVIAEPFRVA